MRIVTEDDARERIKIIVMRFITEFEIPSALINHPKRDEYVRIAKDRCGLRFSQLINESFEWSERAYITDQGPIDIISTLEIEAFPMDKWIEFKRKLFAHLGATGLYEPTFKNLISELESLGKPGTITK